MSNSESNDTNIDMSALRDIPEITFIVPEETESIEQIDKKTYNIPSEEMARRAYSCALDYKTIVENLINKCNMFVSYAEYLASINALACEILLKSMLYYQQHSNICSRIDKHYLFDLYRQLETSVQTKIYNAFFDIEKRFSQTEFEEALKRNQDTFTLYRYAYELKAMSIEYHFIKVFRDALIQVCKDMHLDSLFPIE